MSDFWCLFLFSSCVLNVWMATWTTVFWQKLKLLWTEVSLQACIPQFSMNVCDWHEVASCFAVWTCKSDAAVHQPADMGCHDLKIACAQSTWHYIVIISHNKFPPPRLRHDHEKPLARCFCLFWSTCWPCPNTNTTQLSLIPQTLSRASLRLYDKSRCVDAPDILSA